MAIFVNADTKVIVQGLTGGQGHTDRLVHGGQRQRGHQLRPGLGERPDLRQVVVARLPGVHHLADDVAVP